MLEWSLGIFELSRDVVSLFFDMEN